MKRYKVRFHLARGDNYMKWQVTDSQKDTKSYFDPNLKSIVMRDCILGNHPKTAMRIHNGENKTVCAWVACDDLAVVDTIPLSSTMRLADLCRTCTHVLAMHVGKADQKTCYY